jgi:hypothetical protein
LRVDAVHAEPKRYHVTRECAMWCVEWRWSFWSAWADQVREHAGASDLGLDKRLKGGAADLYGASALVDRRHDAK